MKNFDAPIYLQLKDLIMKTETVTLPAYWASALINGDYSGISQDFADVFALNLFIEKNPQYGPCLSCSENATIAQYNGLLCECLEYMFPVIG